MCESVATSCLPMPQLSFIVSTPLFPTLSLPCEMAGHQLYDMMHSLLQSIAAGTVSGSPGSGGPTLQLSPQMMQPMSLTFTQPTDHALCTVLSVMPYGGRPNFGNATGALMPFMAQSSMPSSLPEPQPARAADAATSTPATASSTNPHPTDTRPQSHSRRSRSVTDDTATHSPTPVITVDTTSRYGDTPPAEHAAPAGHIPPHGPTAPGDRTATPSPSAHAPPGAGPPNDTPPHPGPRLHIEPRKPTPPKVPLPSGWDTDKSQWSSPRWWNQSWGHPPQSHSTSRCDKHRQHRQLEQSGQATVLATAATWATTTPPIPCQPQQRQHERVPSQCGAV